MTAVPSAPASSPAARHARRADPPRARPRRPGRARRARPRAGPRRLDRRRPRGARRGQCQGQAAGLRWPRAFKTGEIDASPAISASGSRPRCASSALDRLGLEARAGNLVTGADQVEAEARRGAGPPAAPRRRCQRRRAAGSSTRPGGSAGGERRGWFSPWKGPYCHWRWAAKMWYMPPSSIRPPRARVSHALGPVASFYRP